MAERLTVRTVRNGMVAIQIDTEVKREKRTAQGIILPEDTLGQIFRTATVKHVGLGIVSDAGQRVGMEDLKPGDRVIAKVGMTRPVGPRGSLEKETQHSYYEIDLGPEGKLQMIHQSDIILVLNSEQVPDEPVEAAAANGGLKIAE